MRTTLTSCDGSEDQFGAEATRYANSRPTYPRKLVEHFTSSIPQQSRKWALDVAAGSGQLSVLLADDFEHVVALDKSEEQLKKGIPRPNITYCAGTATNLPHPDDNLLKSNGKFDAITCAQAYHWFVAENQDEAFLKEACRVLDGEHGRLGVFGYGVCSITSSPKLEAIFKDFYYNKLGSNLPPSSPDCYWDFDLRLLDNCLEGISTYEAMEVVDKKTQIQTQKMTPHDFLDFLRTFSALSNLRKSCAAKGEMDPMERLHREFESNTTDGEVLDVDFPFFLTVLKPRT